MQKLSFHHFLKKKKRYFISNLNPKYYNKVVDTKQLSLISYSKLNSYLCWMINESNGEVFNF